MGTTIETIEQYVSQLPDDRKLAIEQLRKVFNTHLPAGFHEEMSYGMIGYVVPHTIYPKGYHCNTKLPLPFLSIASQKNFIAIYHMGIYANPTLMEWFLEEYPKHTQAKLDMGKSCIRFKKVEQIPFSLFEKLAEKMSVQHWIETYENAFVKKQ